MGSDLPPNTLAAIEQEIAAERASTLGRSGRLLEGLLAELKQIEADAAVTSGEARAPLVRLHADVRQEAERRRWFLTIERETVGLRDHHLLDELYPLPAPLR